MEFQFLEKIIGFIAMLSVALINNMSIVFRTRHDKQNIIIQEICKNLNYTYANPKKMHICNLFKQLTGLHLNFKDIQVLATHDDVGKIIYQITKYKGIYIFQNGKFIEKRSKFITKLSNFFIKLLSIVIFILLILLAILFFSANSTSEMVVYFVYMVVLSIFWIYNMKTLDDINEAKALLANFSNKP